MRKIRNNQGLVGGLFMKCLDLALKEDFALKTTASICSFSLLQIFSFCFSYAIESGSCYLALCEKSFSKRLAFSYLEDIQAEFNREYGSEVATATRPYCFIEFGEFSSVSCYLIAK